MPSREQEITSRSTIGEHQLQLSPAYDSHRGACKSIQDQEGLEGDSDNYHLSDRDDDDHLHGPVPLIDLTWVNSQAASIETSVYEPTSCHSYQTLTTTEVICTSYSKTTAASLLHQPQPCLSPMTTTTNWPLCQPTPYHHNSPLQQLVPLHRLVTAVIPLQQPAPLHPQLQITAVSPAIHQQPRQHHQFEVSVANPQSPM